MREAYPHGIGHLDPARQQLARRDMPKVNLPQEQITLVQRLDQLMVRIWNAWLIRDLDKTPLPPQPVLAQRLWEGGERVRDSLFSRAEMIVLVGIVSPEQADQALTAVWEQCGISALLDPALAARLRLTRTQLEELLFLLDSKKGLSNDLSEAVKPFWHLSFTDPQAKRQVDQLTREAENQKEDVDVLILSQVLNASQARTLVRILGGKQPRATRPVSGAKKSNRPG
jgi:hypothetical protein